MFLVPNRTIMKKGLQGGKLESKKEYLELTEEVIKLLGNTLFHFKKAGFIVDKIPTVAVKPGSVEDLRNQATELGIEFKSKTTKAELEALIDAEKKEISEKEAELEELKKQAKELEIEFDDDISIDALTLLVEEKLD